MWQRRPSAGEQGSMGAWSFPYSCRDPRLPSTPAPMLPSSFVTCVPGFPLRASWLDSLCLAQFLDLRF